MKELPWQEKPTCVGTAASFSEAFHVAFSKKTLEEAHGGPVEMTEWKAPTKKGTTRLERILNITSPLPSGFPDALRSFVGNSNTFRMTVKQIADVQGSRARVQNKTRLHVLGAEFIRMKPMFDLSRDETTGCVFVNANVRVVAWMPPPIKGMVETLLVATSKINLDAYMRAIANNMSHDIVR
jgi:hypothetical protein